MSSSFQQLNASDGGLDAEFRAADDGLNSVVALGEDFIAIGKQDISIKIFTPSTSTLPQSALGLGRNSTFIETLYDNQMVASRTWSLFWGLEGGSPGEQMDGSLIIGGYDRAKTAGPNMTQTFSSFADQALCPSSMIVDVADISVTFANGTSTSLLDTTSTGFRACIKPDIPLLTLPTDIFTAFSDSIGGTFIAPSESYKLWGMDFAASGVFDGDLTYTFASGFQITIDNGQLVVPDVQVTDAGATFIPDEAVRELLIYADPVTGSDMPLLGQVFMTSAYLHVNNDDQEFTMWQSQPTGKQDIVTVGDACILETVSGPSQSTLSPAQFAGIAISGVVAIAFSALCGYWYLRRRRMRKDLESMKEAPPSNNVDTDRFSKAELAGSTAKVPALLKSELDGNTTKPLPESPGWKNARFGYREVGGQHELPAQQYHEMPS